MLISHDPKLVSSSSCIGEIWLRSRWSCTCKQILTLYLLAILVDLQSRIILNSYAHALLILRKLTLLVHVVPASSCWLLSLVINIVNLHWRRIVRKYRITSSWLHNSLISTCWFRLYIWTCYSHLRVCISSSKTCDIKSSIYLLILLLLKWWLISPLYRIRLSVVVLPSFPAVSGLRTIRMTPGVWCTATIVISAFHF